MCKWCMKHGAGGKWYLNARNYLKEVAESVHACEYLDILWGRFERLYDEKIFGVKLKNASYRLNTPLIGRLFRWYIQRGIEKEKNHNPRLAQGHLGQVIPLEEAKIVVRDLADPVVKSLCPCRWMHAGIRQDSCLAFTALSEVLTKLPRFIPKNGLKILPPDHATHFLEDMNSQGKVHTIWFAPVPYIGALCSCEYPHCTGLRVRLDFGINVVYKGEYVAAVDPVKCAGCRRCASRCQFAAISFSSTLGRPIINVKKCYGCGLCKEVCEEKAIELVARNMIPVTLGRY